MKKVLSFYSIWEDPYFTGTMTALLKGYGLHAVATPEEADILVFNGGADIATEIYNENPIMRGIPRYKQPRDKHEVALYDQFVGSKFMMGICRGAQLLNCLNGGRLWQHVYDHQRSHKMVDLTTGEVIEVTSTHHQMMRPNGALCKIIGVSNICTSRESEGEQVGQWYTKRNLPAKIEDGEDIEVVWYPNTRSLCIQGHPEYVPGSRFADWSFDLMISKYKDQLSCVA